MSINFSKKVVIAHDGLLTISVGSSRKSRRWKAKSVSWSGLLGFLSQTRRTTETRTEYRAMAKDEQDQIKDVGGFVGGRLKGENRTAVNMGTRQLVTLDADYAKSDFWSTVELLTGFASCIYSTHKHSSETPRFRWVIPLTRPVGPDEYQAVARKLASMVGIDNFDDTTYQPHRLMYWPSTSMDGEFVFRYKDSAWANPDELLAEYGEDWHDQSLWPVSSRQSQLIKREMKKQQDPLEKSGIIGQFCRAYTIQEAIAEFLPDEYEECAGGDRYTYKAGSSTGGAVAYDDKFLYSHHATDPGSMQLLNAFDLVRVHKFGAMDEGKSADVIATALPSYKAMCEFASKDKAVKVLAVKEAQDSAGDLFEDLGDEPDDLSWAEKLKCNGRTGKILSTRENIRLILTNDKHFKGVLGWDSFAQRIAMVKKASWRSADDDNPYWDDADDSQVRYLLETCYEIDSRPKIEDEVLNVASMYKFHPVRDFLNGLVWDHQPRMEKLFIDYLGAEDTPYVRAVTRKMLIAAVGRVMKPGLKFDNMVVLEGRQGLGKSYLLKKLGGKWFNDSLTTVQGKEAYEQLRGGWIYEMSELAALKKSEIEPVKQFISKQVDSYRVAYGRRMSEFPRQCVFIGTTNESTFLRDSTGNRRFWPVSCGVCEPVRSLWSDESTEWIHQVWAEALEAYKGGETVWLGAEIEQEAVKAQEAHTEENELVGMVAEFLDKPIPANWYELDIAVRKEVMQGTGFAVDEADSVLRDKVCLAEIWVEMLGGDMTRFDFHSKKRIADAMNKIPWWVKGTTSRFGSSYGTQKCWKKNKRIKEELDKLLS